MTAMIVTRVSTIARSRSEISLPDQLISRAIEHADGVEMIQEAADAPELLPYAAWRAGWPETALQSCNSCCAAMGNEVG